MSREKGPGGKWFVPVTDDGIAFVKADEYGKATSAFQIRFREMEPDKFLVGYTKPSGENIRAGVFITRMNVPEGEQINVHIEFFPGCGANDYDRKYVESASEQMIAGQNDTMKIYVEDPNQRHTGE